MPRNGGKIVNLVPTAPPAVWGLLHTPSHMLTHTYLEAPILTSATSRLFFEKNVLRASLSSSNSFSEFKFPTNRQKAAEEGNGDSQLGLRVVEGLRESRQDSEHFIKKVTSKISVLSPL